MVLKFPIKHTQRRSFLKTSEELKKETETHDTDDNF
jgi:hypothetical protein